MDKKTNDRWVSQFLLRRFVRDGRLWVYDKVARRCVRRPTKDICCEKGFTTFSPNEISPGIDGKFVETGLSGWEREQSRTIAGLVNNRTIEAISPWDFWELVRFAIWLYFCNPVHRAVLCQSRTELQLLNIKAMSGADLDNLSIKFFGILLPHAYLKEQLEIAVAKDGLLQSEFLEYALKGADSVFDLVRKEYSWSLADYKSLGSVLCTSDRPVLLGGKTLSDPVGFNTPEATLFFPLSPDLCLTGRNTGENKRFIQRSNIVTFSNFLKIPLLLMWAKSNQYIIAAEKLCLPTPGTDLPSYTPAIFKQGGNIGILHR